MSERRGRRRVGQVIGWDVNRLHRGDRTLVRRGDAFLELAHFGSESRLVTDRGRNAAEKCRHLGARLREAENVVDEQQDVLSLLVTEVLCNRQCTQRDPRARAGRFVHLAVDQRGLRENGFARLELGLAHLEEKVVTLTSTLTDAREAGHTTVCLRDVVDQFHDQNRLADTRAAEETDLAALAVWSEKVDDLDARLEDLDLGALIHERRRLLVNRRKVGRVHRTAFVHRRADDVQDAAEALFANGHRDRSRGVLDRHPSDQTIGRIHRDRADCILTEVLRNLEGEVPILLADRGVANLNRSQNRWQTPLREGNVHDWTNNLSNTPVLKLCHVLSGFLKVGRPTVYPAHKASAT